MPELPEVYNLAKQMGKALGGKQIAEAEVRQPKCLNLPVKRFTAMVVGKVIGPVRARGKWVFAKLEPDAYFLLSLGMGGAVLYHRRGQALPEKRQVGFHFKDGSALSIAFSWFGYAHAVSAANLKTHKMTASLGLSPLDRFDFTYDAFTKLLQGRRGAIKPVLMDQHCIAGIGNVYIQDTLFRARLHPGRRIPDIPEEQRRPLFFAIRENLQQAARLGGLAYERDLYNRPGRFSQFLVGYREGQPCPECGTAIEKIRTGTTASFICPSCQA